jgi:hypothetical protein
LKTQKPTFHKRCQGLVKKFCVVPIDWPNQIKIAQSLLRKFPSIQFWENVEPIKLKNLAFFLTKKGEALLLLEQKKANLTLEETKKVSLEKEKLGEDFVVKSKKKPFLNFKTYK